VLGVVVAEDSVGWSVHGIWLPLGPPLHPHP